MGLTQKGEKGKFKNKFFLGVFSEFSNPKRSPRLVCYFVANPGQYPLWWKKYPKNLEKRSQ